MDKDKNINIKLMPPDDDKQNEIDFSFSYIIANTKRYFLIWLVTAVVAAMTVSGLVMLLKTSISENIVTALVNFNYEGVEKGLDPAGEKFDINKIKSPNNIESALTELNIPLQNV